MTPLPLSFMSIGMQCRHLFMGVAFASLLSFVLYEKPFVGFSFTLSEANKPVHIKNKPCFL